MAIKRLIKDVTKESEKSERRVQDFIAQGGRLAIDDAAQNQDDDHRLTLRIPKSLLDKVDIKRRQRIGTISRNLWILELIEKATR
jgi:hypothetical protein